MGGLFGGKKSEKPLGEERRGKGNEEDFYPLYVEKFPPPPLLRRGSAAPDMYGLFNDDGGHNAYSKSHANPNERYTERLKAMNFVMVSKAEADKLISKGIAHTLRNHKDTKRKKGKGMKKYDYHHIH